MKSNIFLIALLSVLISCNRKAQDFQLLNPNLIHICFDSLKQKNILNEHINECCFVKLQTDENCLMNGIVKMDFDDNKIFIKDINTKIFVFDENGNFLNRIGKIGPGPDEQLSIDNFCLDKINKTVNVFDVYKSMICKYSYSGKLLTRLKVDADIFKDVSNMTMAEDGNIILSIRNRHTNLHNYILVESPHYDKIKKFIPFIATGEIGLAGFSAISQCRNDIYFTTLLSDTIFKYDNKTKTILPDIVYKGKFRPLTRKDITNSKVNDISEVFNVVRKDNLSLGILSLYVNDKYIFFQVQGGYNIFWDRYSNTGSYCHNCSYGIISANENYFVSVMDAEEILAGNWDNVPQLKALAKQTAFDDNPILVFYNIN
jgi:hypothetical protein